MVVGGSSWKLTNAVIAFVVGTMILASAMSLLGLSGTGGGAAYADHAPIVIVGDSAFTAENGTTGGTGTESDPYIIEGWNITAGTSDGIAIMNTNAFFIIRGVHVHDSISPGRGIFLNNTSHGTIEDSLLDSHQFGALWIGSCTNSTVRNNTIGSAMQGVWMYNSGNCTLSNNIITNVTFGVILYQSRAEITANSLSVVSQKGIYLYMSNDSVITGNTILQANEGISLRMNSLRNLISANEIHGQYNVGSSTAVHIEPFSTDNTIAGNTVYDMNSGILLEYALRTNVSNNTGHNISGSAFILFGYSDDGTASSNRATECWAGVSTYASQRCTVESNEISDCYYGIMDDHGIDQVFSGNSLQRTTDRGLTLDHTRTSYVQSNDITGSGAEAVLLSATDHITLTGNTIADNTGWGISSISSTYLTMTTNKFSSNGIFLQGSSIEYYSTHSIGPDNTVNSKPVAYLSNMDGVLIDGASMGEVMLANCSNAMVSNLTIADSDVGIQIAYCANATVSDCNISMQKRGLQVAYSTDVVIEKDFAAQDDDGFEILDSSHFLISNCTASGNNFVGVDLESSDNGTLDGNRMISSGTGIFMFDCDQINLTMSRIGANDIGAWVDRSTSVLVYHNDFLYNTIQAQTQIPPECAWNDTYPTGGNFWSDYTGPDHKSGPAQTSPLPDGIGDDPFVVGTYVTDYYPLMNPVTNANTAPVASFVVDPGTGDITTDFSFNASGSTDLEDPLTALEFRWDWNGDGIYDTDWTGGATQTHFFLAPGTYNVTLEVRDSGGMIDTMTKTVVVSEVIPEFGDLLVPILGLAVLFSVIRVRRQR